MQKFNQNKSRIWLLPRHRMRIRNKILIYFSSTVIVLLAFAFSGIFILFSEYREEEFQQQQNAKIQYTIKLIDRYKQMSAEVSYLLDEQDINDFYDEKLLIYNKDKRLIFASLDSLEIDKANSVLNNLSVNKRWIETKDGDYDLIGVYTEHNQSGYYAISKAYDAFGYDKMYFLRNVLIGIFIGISVVVLLISFYLSNRITKPIERFTSMLNRLDFTNESEQIIERDNSSSELKNLTDKFSELLARTRESFAFQKHSIHHISHELKTPLAVLLTELERLSLKNNLDEIKNSLDEQIIQVKFLGDTINALLQISKIETRQNSDFHQLRIDEILFDKIAEVNKIQPDFNFDIQFHPKEFTEEKLIVKGNETLLKQALSNLLMNAGNYSDDQKAQITIDCSPENEVHIIISNSGKSLTEEEQKHLFTHFFRGGNTQGKNGFGLGLALTKRILELHSANISYHSPDAQTNVFKVQLKSI